MYICTKNVKLIFRNIKFNYKKYILYNILYKEQ